VGSCDHNSKYAYLYQFIPVHSMPAHPSLASFNPFQIVSSRGFGYNTTPSIAAGMDGVANINGRFFTLLPLAVTFLIREQTRFHPTGTLSTSTFLGSVLPPYLTLSRRCPCAVRALSGRCPGAVRALSGRCL
jgi:hypothetical protein